MNDLRFAFRQLLKNRGFAAIAIATLALGIGVNTAMFSIIDGIMLRGLPTPEAHRLYSFFYINPGTGDTGAGGDGHVGVSQLELDDFRAQQQSFIGVAGFDERTSTIQVPGGDPERVSGNAISSSGPTMLQAPLAFGRWFNADEDRPGAAGTVVIGYNLWKRMFQSDPGVLGKPVKIGGEWANIIGVAGPDFAFPNLVEIWYPPRGLHLDEKRDQRPYQMFGRLRPGVTAEQARAELLSIAKRLAADHPELDSALVPYVTTLNDTLTDQLTRVILTVMLAAVLFVLLIACGNVANLLLARATARQKEMAIRAALGASRQSLVRLLLVETLVLVVVGSAFGLVIAEIGLEAFRRYIVNIEPPYWMVFRLDGAALLYTAAIAGVACLLAGLHPALRISRPDLNSMLVDAARGSTSRRLARFTRWLVVGEVALSCLLLVLSALMIRSVIKMHTSPLGFSTTGVYSGRVTLPDALFKGTARQRDFYLRLAERLRSRPEIESSGLCDLEVTWNSLNPVLIDGRAAPKKGTAGPAASIRAISPGYLETLRIPLQRGRDLTEADTAESMRVALVSTAFAEKYWPGEDPLGKRLRQTNGSSGEEVKWLTVVGVVPPTMQGRFDITSAPQVYVPFTQYDDIQRLTIFARARGGDPAALAPVLRDVVRGLNDELPIYFAKSLERAIADATTNKKLVAALFGVFGAVAFVLSAVGLYGVMSYSVSQRRNEIGVRVALGATPRHIIRMVLREGGWQLGVGLALGVVFAIVLGRFLASILYGVTPADSISYFSTVLTLGTAGFVATLVPAYRALRIDPAEVLRAE